MRLCGSQGSMGHRGTIDRASSESSLRGLERVLRRLGLQRGRRSSGIHEPARVPGAGGVQSSLAVGRHSRDSGPAHLIRVRAAHGSRGAAASHLRPPGQTPHGDPAPAETPDALLPPATEGPRDDPVGQQREGGKEERRTDCRSRGPAHTPSETARGHIHVSALAEEAARDADQLRGQLGLAQQDLARSLSDLNPAIAQAQAQGPHLLHWSARLRPAPFSRRRASLHRKLAFNSSCLAFGTMMIASDIVGCSGGQHIIIMAIPVQCMPYPTSTGNMTGKPMQTMQR